MFGLPYERPPPKIRGRDGGRPGAVLDGARAGVPVASGAVMAWPRPRSGSGCPPGCTMRPQGEQPPDPAHPPMARLPEEGHGLEPAEYLFNQFPLLLTDGIVGMAGRPRLDGAASVGQVLRDVERQPQTPEGRDKAPGVVALLAPTVAPRRRFVAIEGRLPLRRPDRLRHASVNDQAVAVVYQRVAVKDQLRFPLRISRASALVVEAWVAFECRWPWKFTVGLSGSSGRACRALLVEVLGRQELVPLGLRQHPLEERPGDVAAEQPLPILREHGRVPDPVILPRPTNQRKSRW